jgi:hypothetical protein
LWKIYPHDSYQIRTTQKPKTITTIEKLQHLLSKRNGETQIDCEFKKFIFHIITNMGQCGVFTMVMAQIDGTFKKIL